MPQISNPTAGGKPCELSPYRHRRLRLGGPRREFRDEFVEPSNLDIAVGLVGGANGTLRRVLESSDR
jgi:hypothetical protein